MTTWIRSAAFLLFTGAMAPISVTSAIQQEGGENDAGSRGFEVTDDTEPVDVATTSSSPTRFGTYHALLIGVQDYTHFPKLRTPLNDVRRVEQILREQYGFTQIQMLTDAQASQKGVLRALRGYAELGKEDHLLIYYAGHGYLDKETEKGYWIPSEAQNDDLDWISNAELKERIADIGAAHTLLISDSCFSGSLTRGFDVEPDPERAPDPAPSPTPGPDNYIQRVAALDSYQVIASGGLEEVADSGHGGLSAFAYYLVRSLETQDRRFLTARELFGSVVRMVANDSNQVPEWGRIQGAKDERGEFVFERIDGVASDPSLPTTPLPIPAGWNLPPGVEWVERPEPERPNGLEVFRSTNRDVTDMVLVLPGEFPFGDPRLDVSIDTPYLIDEHEVTVARFREFLKSETIAELPHWNQEGYDGEDQPVVGIDLETALAFANWAGKKLPDEHRWEYAATWDARASRRRTYPWGNSFEGGKVARTPFLPAVGADPLDRSPWGVMGMGSGIREWCLLPEGDDRRGQNLAVLRGASQFGRGRKYKVDLPATWRKEVPSETRSADVGFRCIMSLYR